MRGLAKSHSFAAKRTGVWLSEWSTVGHVSSLFLAQGQTHEASWPVGGVTPKNSEILFGNSSITTTGERPSAQGEEQLGQQMSDVLKRLHLKVAFGRKWRFQNVHFSQVAEAPRKVRGRGFSIMYSRKLRGRATVQSRKHAVVVFLHARKRKRTSIPFLNPRRPRGSDSLFKPLAEAIPSHAAQAPRKASRRKENLRFLFGRNWV